MAPAAPRPKWPWVVGGCGCLTLIAIIGTVALVMLAGVGAKSKQAKYDPYRGPLSALLPAELSKGVIKFKLAGATDRLADWQKYGAKETLGFTYEQTAMGVMVPVLGALSNFATSAEAEQALRTVAAEKGATLQPKGGGHRFMAGKGEFLGWTNGSLLCVATSQFERPAQNFEEAAPF